MWKMLKFDSGCELPEVQQASGKFPAPWNSANQAYILRATDMSEAAR
jgi:hypothetical protein